MKNETSGKIIADEVWRMLPDSCKEIMKNLEVSFKESVAADVDDIVEKVVKNQKRIIYAK